MNQSSTNKNEEAIISQTKRKSPLLTVCPFILVTELCERLAYYGMYTNLVVYFTELGASSANAASSVNAFSGTCYVLPLLGGWLADTYYGRFNTILFFSIVYFIGLCVLSINNYIPGWSPTYEDNGTGTLQWLVISLSLLLIALGTGGIKPNVSSFGADQFEENSETDRKEKSSFFNWFYFFINTGALVATVLIVPIQDNGHWGLGFSITAVSMLVALLIFIAGKWMYKYKKPKNATITLLFNVTYDAIKNRMKYGKEPLSNPDVSDVQQTLIQHQWLDKHWLNYASLNSQQSHNSRKYSFSDIEDIKLVYGILPIACSAIFYWVIYSQMGTMFVLNGTQMNPESNILGMSFSMPSASMSFFNVTSIMIIIPIYDQILVPLMQKCCNYTPSMLQRMGAGYILAVLAMLSSYLIEKKRLALFQDGKILEGNIVDMSIWWLSIPYTLVGASEVLASVSQLEFFYDQAPDSMRSIMLSVQLLCVGIAGYLSSGFVSIVSSVTESLDSPWITDDLNQGHLDYYYLLLAVVMALISLLFLVQSLRYKYKEIKHGNDQDEVETATL